MVKQGNRLFKIVIPGLPKLQRKIKQELKFLEKFESTENTRKSFSE